MVSNSQQGVFASNGFTGYWRRVQKSFLDFIGFRKIGRVPNLDLFFALSYNRHLALPTAGIASVAISSRTRFAE